MDVVVVLAVGNVGIVHAGGEPDASSAMPE
jgi:hypothetical protein